MSNRRFPISKILLAAGLVCFAAAAAVLAPKTIDSYKALQVEQNATPTPTLNVSSVLLVTPDPNSTPAPTMLLLKIGSSGDEVKKLQAKLYELGYYSGGIDGQYGQGTAEAVKLFQSQNGLTDDGVAGDGTRNALYGGNAVKFVPTPAPTATPSVIKMGDDNDAVKALQSRLKELGYYSGSIDGDFGGGTEEAVRLFQSQSGLDADGIAAEKTLGLLFSADAKQAVATPTPDPNAMPILVNRTHPVDKSYKPSNLVLLRKALDSSLVYVKGSQIEGDKTAVKALETMFKAAKDEGVTAWQVSAGYRSPKYQQELFDKQVKAYRSEGMSKEKATSATKLTVAEPGQSEHHTGLAFDITVAGTTFKGTEQQKWLAKNCWDYGFIIRYQEDKEDITGFLAECWHIRYVGTSHSVKMRDKNLCLEEYLGMVD